MSDAPKAEAPAEGAAPAKPKSKLPLMAGAAVLVLAGAGGGGYWWWSHRAPAVAGAETAKEVEENAVERAQLQSTILEILTVHTAEELVTPDGKKALKKEILEKTGHVLHSAKVTDVLFTEFVVQF